MAAKTNFKRSIRTTRQSNPVTPSGIGVGASGCPSCPAGVPLWHRASNSWRCGVVVANQPHGSGGGVATPGMVCGSDEVWAKTAQGGPYFCGVPCNGSGRQSRPRPPYGSMNANFRARSGGLMRPPTFGGNSIKGYIGKCFYAPDGTLQCPADTSRAPSGGSVGHYISTKHFTTPNSLCAFYGGQWHCT